MRKIFAVVLLMMAMVAAGKSVQAQQPAASDMASRDQVVKLMGVMNSRAMIDKMVPVMRNQVTGMMQEMFKRQAHDLPEEKRAEIEKLAVGYVNRMLDSMPIDAMLEAIAGAYQKRLTRAEVEAMTAFYSSPAGQSVLNKMPVIMAETMEGVQPIIVQWATAKQEEMTVELKKAVERAAEAGKAKN